MTMDLSSDNLGLVQKLGRQPLGSNLAAVNSCNREMFQQTLRQN
jgi:hypothetical protein